jgi:hypothetical protein
LDVSVVHGEPESGTRAARLGFTVNQRLRWRARDMSRASITERFGLGRVGELPHVEKAKHLDEERLDLLADPRLGAFPIARHVEHTEILDLDPGRHL